MFGKRHDNVIQAIKKLECSSEFNVLNFKEVKYLDSKGEERPSYTITKDGFVFLAMGFTGKKAAEFKEAYIAEFNKMESAINAGVYGDLAAIADLVVARQMTAIRDIAMRNARLEHEVSFLSHFKPTGRPGELAKSGLPKNQFRRGFYVSKNGRDTSILIEHPSLPGLFEEYKQVQG